MSYPRPEIDGKKDFVDTVSIFTPMYGLNLICLLQDFTKYLCRESWVFYSASATAPKIVGKLNAWHFRIAKIKKQKKILYPLYFLSTVFLW